MLGLRVRVRGRSPLTLALPQEQYLVVAGASWRRGSPRKRAESYLHGTGIDDRADNLRWLWIEEPARGLWMDVTVVDASSAAAPRRLPRRAVQWTKFFKEVQARDAKRLQQLEARLRQARGGIAYRETRWTMQPPAVGFRISVNGRELGRVGVSDPGALSVDVVVKRSADGSRAWLSVHGGDHITKSTWRWRTWPFESRRLKVGDRVRIEVVAPVRFAGGRVQRIETVEVTKAADIAREIRELRKRLKPEYHGKETANILQYEGERQPPRRYARGNAALRASVR